MLLVDVIETIGCGRWWKELVSLIAAEGQRYEIRCWNDEKQEIAAALCHGHKKSDDWNEGIVIEGIVDASFVDLLCQTERPGNDPIQNKMTAFYSVSLENGSSLSHYGAELCIAPPFDGLPALEKVLRRLDGKASVCVW